MQPLAERVTMKSTTNTQDHASQKRNYWPAFLAFLAISSTITNKAPWSWLTSSGFLLLAWFYYYYPGPGLTKTPRQIYQTFKSGHRRIPRYAFIAGWLGVVTMLLGSLGSLGIL